MAKLCDGRVAIITGAGRGIGREHALMLAQHGAKVVVNDLGGSRDGSGASLGPAEEVVNEIVAAGGAAIANGDDVSDFAGAKRMIDAAIAAFGRLDVLVNNAGILRDRMLVNMTEAEWDAVIKVHLKGTFAPAHHAAAHWRDRAKAGETVDGRIINTSSGAGILGSVGQAAYSAAKAGIATLTLVQAAELGRYGVTANALCPAARTRMTEQAFADKMAAVESGFDAQDPDNIAPTVVWLGSEASKHVTGCVFELEGGRITIEDGWKLGPTVDKQAKWAPAEVGEAVAELLAVRGEPRKVWGT